MICSSCGNQNNNESRFCNGCGATLTGQHCDADAQTLQADGTKTLELKEKDPMLGRSIDGRYRIDSLIGVGGMGSVYRATRLLIGDEVAIKILHTERMDANSSERFRREAQAAARLKHPNAVSIYDFGISTDGLQYLVMEFLEGESLRESTKQGPLDFTVAAEITSQVCAALDEAHRRHIIHRDIKPDNIILSPTPSGLRVKVLDFGIAKLRDETASHITQTGSVMGTPHYMSPEQCLGEELDPRADIYSVGIVLYEMLCGRVPFNSPISTAVVVQHVSQPPPSLRSINPAVPPGLEAVVLHAIEKSRDRRPATAGTLAQELTAALRSAPAPAIGYPRFAQPAPTPFLHEVEVNEETVERARNKVASLPQPNLPLTVHLPSHQRGVPSLPTPRRQTEEGNAAVTGRLKKSVPVKYVAAGLIALLAVALLSLFLLWPEGRRSNENVTTNVSNDGSAQNSSASDQPLVSRDGPKGAARPVTPVGMAVVEGGQFSMGSNKGDQDSKPVHMVTIKSFYIDLNEVTCEAYKRFVDETGRRAPEGWANGTYREGTGKHPVTGVSWEDAAAYARWVGKRLPTEQEWELAARGKSGLRYPWGNLWKPGCANAADEGAARKRFADVGSYNCASPFGAQDLIGNAWEWTASDWVPYPGGRLSTQTTGGEKVIRGGSWQTPQDYATATYRSGFEGVGDKTGFRCAKDMP